MITPLLKNYKAIIALFFYLLFFQNANAQNVDKNSAWLQVAKDDFYDHPEEEFLKGYTQLFEIVNHEKSIGIDWSIQIPMSWDAQKVEDDSGNIQKFLSENGNGQESISFMVVDLPIERKITESEINACFTVKRMKRNLKDIGKFKRFEKMTFDGINGGYLEYDSVLENSKTKARIFQSSFIYNQKLCIVFCAVKREVRQTKDMDRFAKLFRLMAASIKINQQEK